MVAEWVEEADVINMPDEIEELVIEAGEADIGEYGGRLT